MASCYRLHVCTLLFQTAAFLISLSCGTVLLVFSNFAATAKQVIVKIRDDPGFGEESDLKNDTGDLETIASAHFLLLATGAASVASSVVVLVNVLGLLSLILGGEAAAKADNYCQALNCLRVALEDELVLLRGRDELARMARDSAALFEDDETVEAKTEALSGSEEDDEEENTSVMATEEMRKELERLVAVKRVQHLRANNE